MKKGFQRAWQFLRRTFRRSSDADLEVPTDDNPSPKAAESEDGSSSHDGSITDTASPKNAVCDDGSTGGVARLEWVVVDGETRHVSDFVALEPNQRPKATCPVCERYVILKLGRKLRHHAAHYPDASCATTSKESVLHLNTKLYLAAKLKGSTVQIGVSFRCSECDLQRPQLWIECWDSVDVEVRLSQRRPDILLSLGGTPIAAIEVHHTNAVTLEKREDLEATGTPWIEVEAKATIYSGETAWCPGDPLPIKAWSKSVQFVCSVCDDRHAARRRAHDDYQRRVDAARQNYGRLLDEFVEASVTRLKSERENGQVIYKVRVVDKYYPSGRRFREVLMIVGDRSEHDEAFRVVTGSDGKTLGRIVHRSKIRRGELELAEPALNLLRSQVERSNGILDSPMKWLDVFGPLKEDPKAVLHHWIDRLSLLGPIEGPLARAEELAAAVDPETGEIFERPFMPWGLSPVFKLNEGVGYSRVSAMLLLHLQLDRLWRYEWHRQEEKWFIRRANRSIRWDNEVNAMLWPRDKRGPQR
jgi:hypothetical protein